MVYFDPAETVFSKMMRSVSFVDRIELEFSGNHFSHGVCLGDVDGDGVGEAHTQVLRHHLHINGSSVDLFPELFFRSSSYAKYTLL